MADIYLIGTGILSTLHLTTEAKQVIAICNRLYVLHDDLKVISELRKICPDVVDLVEFYKVGEIVRHKIYCNISDEVISAAKEVSPVGLVVHGNPMFLVSAVEFILKEGRQRGLTVRVIPGISSFDTIQCDLGLDLGYAVQLYDSTLLYKQRLNIDARVPLLIFQLATFCNPNLVENEPSPEIISPLLDYLRSFYPIDHICHIVYSPTQVTDRAEIIDIELGKIAKSKNISLRERPTLYVPPVVSSTTE